MYKFMCLCGVVILSVWMILGTAFQVSVKVIIIFLTLWCKVII